MAAPDSKHVYDYDIVRRVLETVLVNRYRYSVYEYAPPISLLSSSSPLLVVVLVTTYMLSLFRANLNS